MSNLTYSRYGRFLVTSTLFVGLGLVGCGGEMMDDGASSAGSVTSGGAGVHPATALGGRNSYTTLTAGAGATTPTMCFGVVEATPSAFNACLTNTMATVDQSKSECIFTVPMASTLRLDPTLLKLYFDVDGRGKLEIPYVGTQASCPTTGTSGGWYATNVTGGTTNVGLCGCTCVAAKKYPVTLAIDCKGVRA